MDTRDNLIDKIQKLMQRSDWNEPVTIPSGECRDVTTHLAGLLMKAHARAILEALRRMD